MKNKTESPLLKRTVRNFVFSSAGTLSRFILGFLFAGLAIRFLGMQRAGFLLTLQALMGLNAFMGEFGLSTPLIHRVAFLHSRGNAKLARSIVGSISVVSLVSAVIIVGLIVFFFPTIFKWSRLNDIYQADAFWATIFMLGSLLIKQISNSWQATYNALQRYDIIAGLLTFFGLLLGVSRLIALYFMPTMTSIGLTVFIISLMRFLCDAFFMRSLLQGFPFPTWNWKEVRPMLGFGGWSYLQRLGGLFFISADRLVLITFLGSMAMPYYAVPQRLFLQIHRMLIEACKFMFPMFASYGDKAKGEIQRTEDRFRWFVALVSGIGYTTLALVGSVIFGKLVSPDFAIKIRIPLMLACIQGFVHSQNIIPYYFSWAVGLGRPNAVMQLINGALVIITAVLLIPRLGFVGASLAQLWIVPTVIIHSLWVRQKVSPQAHAWGWLGALLSPVIMVIVWISLSAAIRSLLPSGLIAFLVAVLLGGIAGTFVLWLIETMIFPSCYRWATLVKAVNIVIARSKKVRQ